MITTKSIFRRFAILFLCLLTMLSFAPVYAAPSVPAEQVKTVNAQSPLHSIPSGKVLGINTTNRTGSSVSYGTTMRDIVLVIDTTAIMAYQTSGNPNASDPGADDPALCNLSHTCQPMEAVKSAAIDFIDLLSFPYDRVGIVTMTSQTPSGSRTPIVVLPIISDKATVQTALENLNVFQPPSCDSLYGVCRDLCTADEISEANDSGDPSNPCFNKTEGYYVGQACPVYALLGNPSSCTSTDVGTSLELAGSEFSGGESRPNAQHIVIALMGSAASASVDATNTFPFGFCPSSTWNSPTSPLCRDGSSLTRHSLGNMLYDADDHARDKADLVTNPDTGLGAKVFTIGLGYQIQNASKGDPDAGEKLLQYIALTAGDDNANHGSYYYAPDTSVLPVIFQAIANTTACSSAIIVANNYNSGAGSLRQAITDVCSGGTITFDPSLSGGTIYLASSLIVDKNLTVDGSALSSQIIISGDTDNNGTGDVGVFNINSGVTATLSDLKIEKGYRTGGRGGGIHNLGALNILNCTLTNNFAANGGGIANDIGATLTVIDSSILNNSSQNDGGGIFNYGGTLTLTRSIISNNFSANFGGGGIANNTAPTNTATSIVTNSTVSNNSTTGYGGGGIVNSGTLTVINSTLANNAASLVVGDGGGILSIGTATFSNSTISGNTAGRNGGGIYTGSALHLKNTLVANSTSGGDCYNYQGDSISTNTNNLIEANGPSGHKCGIPVLTTDPKLGLLADNGGTTQTLAVPFDSPAVDAGNDASCEVTDQRGVTRPKGNHCDIGAFEYYQPNTTVLNANNSGAGSLRQAIAETTPGGTITFDASLSGQTIHLASLLLVDKNLIIDGSSLVSHIQISGDTDNNGTSDVPVFQISLSSTVELNNLDIVKGKGSGASGGGGIANYSTLTVKNSTLSANSYTGGIGGGGIYNKGTLTIIDSTITGNIAEDGGGIFNEYGHTLTITGSTFSDNAAQSANTLRGGGGGIANIGTLSVDDSIFLENIAYSGGGAIVNSIDGTSTVTNSSFTGNSSFGNGVGGAINNYEGGMTIENCTFTSNSDIGGSTNRGGAVYNKDQMSIANSTFIGNTSSRHGGAIANDGTLTVTDVTLLNNSAEHGGAIANFGTLSVTSSNISTNSTSPGVGAGGGILNDGNGVLIIESSTISNNSAPHGGGIFNLSFTGIVNISSSTLSGNSVSGNGGGISNWGTLTATNTTFFGNSAALGGGIFNLGTSTITNSTISANSGLTSGGGIYSENILSYANTIIANSVNGTDCINNGGAIGININNLVQNNALSPNQCGTPGVVADPNLGPLANNGGSTLTISLLPGSPAIDTGDDAVCAAAPVNNTSQNGVTRPLGAHCDIGSFEYVDTIAPAVLSIVRANANPTAATSVDFTVTFSEIVTGVGSADFNITRTGVSGAAISDVNGSGSVYTVTVSTGTGEGSIRLDIPASAVIKDLSNNSLNGLPYITGQTYSIKHPSIPRPPALRSPRTNLTTNDATPTFLWARVKDGQSYEIVFATDAAFSIGVVSQIVSEPSYAVTTSISDDEYFWHVRAYNSANQYGPWSSTRSFTIDTAGPLAPQLNFPLDTDSLSRTPIFKWGAVAGAVLYEFQYDNNEDFSSPYKVTTRGTFRRPAAMKPGIYYWCVRAKDASGNWGEWSTPFAISITRP